MVWNISASGVRIEHASVLVEPGARVGLRSSFFPGSFDVELMGEVVRHTEAGFAMRFIDVGPLQRELLHLVLPRLTRDPSLDPESSVRSTSQRLLGEPTMRGHPK